MPRVKVPVSQDQAPLQLQQTPATEVVAAPAQVQHEPAVASKIALTQRFTKTQLMFAAVGAIFLILIIMLLNVMNDRSQLQTKVDKLSTNTAAGSADEVKDLIKQIGAVFQLPSGETPTLATVSDATKVRNQAFFKDAQNGDKVLLYSKAGEAILYRPSTKKIISVAPVNLNGNDVTPTTKGTTSK